MFASAALCKVFFVTKLEPVSNILVKGLLTLTIGSDEGLSRFENTLHSL